MYKVKVGYLLELEYSAIEDAQEAQKWLFQGGATEVTIKFVPIEEAGK